MKKGMSKRSSLLRTVLIKQPDFAKIVVVKRHLLSVLCNERSIEKTHFTSRHNYDTVMAQEEVN